MRLLEDSAKAWLRDDLGLPAPEGRAADSAESALAVANALGGAVVVKALVAAGRRGKADAVRVCHDAKAAGAAAQLMLRRTVAGQRVERVYIEKAIDIAHEFYLGFTFADRVPLLVVSRQGGVDIEETAKRGADAIHRREISPLDGLSPWAARRIWDEAGVASDLVPKLGSLTVRLYEAFRGGDALMLEINPLAVTSDGELCIVGAMAEIDDCALSRQPAFRQLARQGLSARLTAGERLVREANERFPGGAVRYAELEGNIGLLVAGGGAGLLQHDMIVAAGGRPANHSDISPTPTPDKPAAVFDAIFSNPKVRGLLVGYNYLQMARCDLVIRALLMSMERNGVDSRRLPIVIRLFGPAEDEARQLVAGHAGITYLPPGSDLSEGCRAIVDAVNRVVKTGEAA